MRYLLIHRSRYGEETALIDCNFDARAILGIAEREALATKSGLALNHRAGDALQIIPVSGQTVTRITERELRQ